MHHEIPSKKFEYDAVENCIFFKVLKLQGRIYKDELSCASDITFHEASSHYTVREYVNHQSFQYFELKENIEIEIIKL